MLETLNRKRAKIIKFYRVTKYEVFSVNFRDVMVASGFYANKATKHALICLRKAVLLGLFSERGRGLLLERILRFKMGWD